MNDDRASESRYLADVGSDQEFAAIGLPDRQGTISEQESRAARPPQVQVQSDGRPLSLPAAVLSYGQCVVQAGALLRSDRIRKPATRRGLRLRFADGTSARVYRETAIDGAEPTDPVTLVVCFRLRAIRSVEGHSLFRLESLLNTVLFAGFPGFVSKLWLSHDGKGRYRGLYDWDGAERAARYARALWWALAAVSELESIHYVVVPGIRRDELVKGASGALGPPTGEWWRIVGTFGPASGVTR